MGSPHTGQMHLQLPDLKEPKPPWGPLPGLDALSSIIGTQGGKFPKLNLVLCSANTLPGPRGTGQFYRAWTSVKQ